MMIQFFRPSTFVVIALLAVVSGCKREDGEPCTDEAECLSDHCQNGFCCGQGDCCQQPVDCPELYSSPSTCNDAASCQGSAFAAVCQEFVCDSAEVEDDSGCDEGVLVSECGPYLPVFCSGEPTQSAPACSTSCVSDLECDEGYHCDEQCAPDINNGEACDEPSDCDSGHCQNGFCCASGDCCAEASDCPAGYAEAPQCDDAISCQGTRRDAQCVDFICATSDLIDDDTGCTEGTLSKECGPYPSVYCSGLIAQEEPICGASCVEDFECDPGFHCDGTCQPNLEDGLSCDEASDCQSSYCQNGFCCLGGDCCAAASDCPAQYIEGSVCDEAMSCQGHRRDAVCEQSICAVGPEAPDDSGCAGLLSDECGLYPAVYCSAASEQSPPLCAASCADDDGCDPDAHCDGVCVYDAAPGDPCDEPSDCLSGLSCVDGVCCASACSGLCRACDLPGDVGECADLPRGDDPDNECGGLSCAGYYWGWSGDSCYTRADAPNSGVDCNGTGGCETPAQVCPSMGQGSSTLTCHALCQEPTGGTCTSTTPGACTNVNPGTVACGVGACQRTFNVCTNGAPNTCVPGQPGAETCDNTDQDCNSVVDDNIAGAADGNEPNNSCGVSTFLGTVPEDNGEMSWARTIYPSGDEDWFRFYFDEGGHTCFPGTNQDYAIRVRLVPPAGSDCVDYDVSLYNDSCGVLRSSTNGSCTAEVTLYTHDGICGGNDSAYFRARVYPFFGWECVPYTLYIDTWLL